MSTIDLMDDPTASVTISLAQNGYCKHNNLDTEDPRCAHVILAGEVVPLEKDSAEETFAKEVSILKSVNDIERYWQNY